MILVLDRENWNYSVPQLRRGNTHSRNSPARVGLEKLVPQCLIQRRVLFTRKRHTPKPTHNQTSHAHARTLSPRGPVTTDKRTFALPLLVVRRQTFLYRSPWRDWSPAAGPKIAEDRGVAIGCPGGLIAEHSLPLFGMHGGLAFQSTFVSNAHCLSLWPTFVSNVYGLTISHLHTGSATKFQCFTSSKCHL